MLEVTFRDGVVTEYSRTLQMFWLLKTDNETIMIVDTTTGEILYDKETHQLGSGINDLE